MNGLTRVRDEDEPASKRSSRTATPLPPSHYDIYALPCTMCPLAVHPSTFFKSASFVVVNRAVGLSSGLGIRYGLTTLDGGLTLTPQRDPGFFLAREPTYDPSKAVLLGWVEEDQLSFFDSIIETVPVPRVVGSGLETKEWLLAVAGKLEMEGIVSNGDILLDDILVLRQ
ncbi:hypothetical protein T439DRAFT_195917 [Meredithblackwellia eburnea MCA 4105]